LKRPLPVKATPTAQRQIEEAQQWWESHRAGARYTIKDELAHASALLGHFPYLGGTCRNVKLKDVRRIHLRRVHCHLYYRVHEGRIEVLAFWHTSRKSGPDI
jgi:plasmid stabilization system protein ParE